MKQSFAGRPSSAQSRVTFSGRTPFVSQRVSQRVNPINNTGGYFYNSNRFDRRLSLTSSSSGVAACLGHSDHFSSKISEHANKNTFQGSNSHAFVRPTHSRGKTSSSVEVHRPLSAASLGSRPFTREEMKQDIRQVSANVIHTFDPVRKMVTNPSVRKTPTFLSSVFAHLPQFNELRNPPRNTELGHGFVQRRAYQGTTDMNNGSHQLAIFDNHASDMPPAGSVNSAIPSVRIAQATQPYLEGRQETAQTMAQMKNGNYVDNTSNKIYGVTHISPTKRRYVEPKNLPSLSDAHQRKEMYHNYKQELINEIEIKERQAQLLKLQNQSLSQKPRTGFEFECYERERNRQREIADVTAQQREQMAMTKQRNALEKRMDIQQGVKSIEAERGLLMDDVDRLQKLIDQKRGKLKKFYESSINARHSQKVKKLEEAKNEKQMIKAAIEQEQELQKRRFEEQKIERCQLASYQIQQMNTKNQNKL